MSIVRYYPGLPVEQMAFLCGVSESAIRRYVLERGIDFFFDESIRRYRIIHKYIKNHPGLSDAEISDALVEIYGNQSGYSPSTIRNFRNSRPRNKKNLALFDKSIGTRTFASVSVDDCRILRAIQTYYLENTDYKNYHEDIRFDCDLTFGKGDFYKIGIDTPRRCYDKYPLGLFDNDGNPVRNLADFDMIEKDESLLSVIIDLPQCINESNVGTSSSFSSLRDVVATYVEMLSSAWRKLISSNEGKKGGILVVKVGDIDYKDERIWLTKIITDLATRNDSILLRKFLSRAGYDEDIPYFKFTLIDKYVHAYTPEKIDLAKAGRRSAKSFDTFLVFRKRVEDTQEVMFAVDSANIFDSSVDDFWRERKIDNYIYGIQAENSCKNISVYSAESKRFRVNALNARNHISAFKPLPEDMKSYIEENFGYSLPAKVNGNIALNTLIENIISKALYDNDEQKNATYSQLREKACVEIASKLSELGIECMVLGNGRRIYFDSKFLTPAEHT